MTTAELRREAKSMIDTVPPRDLPLVREFLEFVARRETSAATRELLAIPGFDASFVRGAKDVKAGRVKPWRRVRTDV